MNYYEQFYDDLEFDDQCYDQADDFDARNYRQKPYDRNENRRGQGRGQNRGQGQRGRGQNKGRGQEAQGRWKGQSQTRGRGNLSGKMTTNFKMTNFVKAGELTPNTEQPVVSPPTETANTISQGNGTQSGFDMGNQAGNQPPPQQENNTFNFSNPYYGYGERTDISSYYTQPGGEGTQPQAAAVSMEAYGYDPAYAVGYYQGYENQPGYEEYWAQQQQAMQQAPVIPDGPRGETMDVTQQTYNSPESSSKAKKPMVIPKMNFVKSMHAFKSTDVAADNAIVTNQGSMAPKSGSRAGLGFGKPPTVIHPGPSENKDIANQDSKFGRLVAAVAEKNKAGKNALEVLHMAVQKVKGMVLDFDIAPVVSTSANFQCTVMVNGIHIGRAADAKKKTAKHSASVEAMNLLTCGKPLTVRKSSSGYYELKPKVVDVLHPAIGNEPTMKSKKGYTPSQGGVITTKQQSTGAASNMVKEKEAAAQAEAYNKPKIVFHSAGQQVAPKPLMGFVKGGKQEGSLSNDGKHSNQTGVGVMDTDTASTPSTSNKPSNTASVLYSKPKIVFHSEGQNPSSKALSGFVKAGELNDKESGNVKDSSKGNTLFADGTKNVPSKNAKRKKNNAGMVKVLNDISQFVLVKYAYSGYVPNSVFLSQSALYNGLDFSCEFDQTGDTHECTLSIGGLEVGEGEGETKAKAKIDACDKVTAILTDVCYTIVFKVQQGYDKNPMEVTKDNLLSGEGQDDQIKSSNIGNALLRKMGWVGGGIGKDGTGIAEPVKASGVIGRKGLGLTGKSTKENEKKFIATVTKILTDFKNMDTEQEIHFSSELAKEERAKIHQIAQQMKLKSVSRGTGDDRYLTISHKRSLDILLNKVIESGGSTDKYEIIPPKNPNLHRDFLRPDAGPMSHSKQ